MGNPITKELTYSDNIIGYKGKRFNVLEKLHEMKQDGINKIIVIGEKINRDLRKIFFKSKN